MSYSPTNPMRNFHPMKKRAFFNKSCIISLDRLETMSIHVGTHPAIKSTWIDGRGYAQQAFVRSFLVIFLTCRIIKETYCFPITL